MRERERELFGLALTEQMCENIFSKACLNQQGQGKSVRVKYSPSPVNTSCLCHGQSFSKVNNQGQFIAR